MFCPFRGPRGGGAGSPAPHRRRAGRPRAGSRAPGRPTPHAAAGGLAGFRVLVGGSEGAILTPIAWPIAKNKYHSSTPGMAPLMLHSSQAAGRRVCSGPFSRDECERCRGFSLHGMPLTFPEHLQVLRRTSHRVGFLPQTRQAKLLVHP